MKHLLFVILILNVTACLGQNLLQNSDFSNSNYGWQTTGSFHYDSRFASCSSCPGYAYFANIDGTAGNDLFGELYQTISIPSNVTAATFNFSYSIHTSEPNTSVNDVVQVGFYVGNTEVWRVIDLSNRSATTYPGGLANYQTLSVPLPPNLIGQVVTVVFRAANNGSNPTVFRIDDVQLNATFGPVGPRSSCVTWTDGFIPSNYDFVNAADYLCSRGVINSSISDNKLSVVTVADASLIVLNTLYNGNIPASLPSDYVPTFFGDIDNLPLQYNRAIKAMCFLEYTDGRPCLSREYSKIQPYQSITFGNMLRMLYEAWNIQPNTAGYNILDHSPSSFLQNIYKDDYNYGYFQQAVNDGILGSYNIGGVLQKTNVKPGEFFIVVLSNLIKLRGIPSFIDNVNYYKPNNVQLSNANATTDITRGVFKTYEQDGLSLPSSGLGLNFIYSYHSDWVDLPMLGYDHYFDDNGNYTDYRAKERNFPLGIGWTHTYNITAQAVYDENNKDKYIIIRWGDGSMAVYDVVTNKFEAGVYDRFNVIETREGHITSFSVTTKDQITTQFGHSTANIYLINPSYYIASKITDPNGNTLTLLYESANCNSAVNSCDGTSNQRLSRVVDNKANRTLIFSYASGTDLLNAITDDNGRGMTFDINPQTLNLQSVTNANLHKTNYTYGTTDKDSHLLMSIQRPRGNTITNTYRDRKLLSTQTPNYVANVAFSAAYETSNPSTQSVVSVIPNTGTQYAITYNQNSSGLVSTVSSASSNITYTYGDNINPTLPTLIVDNNTGLRQSYSYDSKGNVLDSYFSGQNTTVANHYTYDDTNHILTHTWPNGTVASYAYDPYGNKTRESAYGYSMEYGINPDGTVGYQRDATGVQTGFGYNQFGNLKDIVLFLNPLVYFSAVYDPMSRLKSITDGNGNETRYSFDANDNLTSTIVDPTKLSLTTSYQYDENDNVSKITPPLGAEVLLTYDANDELVKEQQGGYLRQWNYNSDGSQKTYIDKAQNTFNNTYYGTNDPNEGKLKSNGFQTFTYDNSKRVLNQVTLNLYDQSTIRYTYDDLLRPNEVISNAPTYQSDVSYTYDISGNITTLSLTNEGKSFSYQYDPLNRLQSIQDWNGKPIVRFNYLNNGLLNTQEFNNGATLFYHYDVANRLDSMYCLKSDAKTLLYSIGCSMDKNGNHTRESSFVQWNGPKGITNPPQGNADVTYDQYSRLNLINGQTIVSDNNGSINRNDPSDFSTATYDPFNHLISCTLDGKIRQFLYDALGNRYGNDSLRYTLDALNNNNILVQRKIGINSPQQLYVYSTNGLVCSIDPQTAEPIFNLYDFRGSTIATLDKGQNVTNYYKYDPWGNITESSSKPDKTTPFLFVGKYGVMYESPHLYYMRARYYDPMAGRFTSEDPKWNSNLFSYAGNNPLINIDPSGQFSLTSPVGIGESIIPIWGSYRSAMYNANQGNYGLAALNTAFAISDIFLVKATATAALKLLTKAAIERGEYSMTKTVANSLATRPYLNSPSTIVGVMESGKGVPDAFVKGGISYNALGSFNGSNGIFELVINPQTRTIYHFLFKSIK